MISTDISYTNNGVHLFVFSLLFCNENLFNIVCGSGLGNAGWVFTALLVLGSCTVNDVAQLIWLSLAEESSTIISAVSPALIASTSFLSWSFLMCFLRSKFLQNPLPQSGHVNGLVSLWVCMWNVRLYIWWNALPHVSHLYCFSLLWVSLWFL